MAKKAAKKTEKKARTEMSREERVTGKAPIDEVKAIKETDNGSNN